MISIKELKKALKELPDEKKQQIRDQITARGRENVIEQILTKHHPEWTREQAIRACTGNDEERDPECSMWWKIAPYTPWLYDKEVQEMARAELSEDELPIFEKKIVKNSRDIKRTTRKSIRRELNR